MSLLEVGVVATVSWLSSDHSKFLVSDDRSFQLFVDLLASDDRRFLTLDLLSGEDRFDFSHQSVGRNARFELFSLDAARELLDLLDQEFAKSGFYPFRLRVSESELVVGYHTGFGSFVFIRFLLDLEEATSRSFLSVSVSDVLWLSGVSLGSNPYWVLFALRDVRSDLPSNSSKSEIFGRYKHLGGFVYGSFLRKWRVILGRFGRWWSEWWSRFGRR
jgi:hypothetical protein